MNTPPVRRHRKATIKDIAERAGVSVTTVSHFQSGRAGVCSAETAERLREAIAHLQYTPNSLSRSLRIGSTRTLGISVGRPARGKDPEFSFIERLWRGIDSATDEAEYSQLYYPASVRYGASLDPFLDGRIDGLILAPSIYDKRPAKIATLKMPLVLVNWSGALPDECGTVYANEHDTVNLAMSHLWSLGHRRIAHVSGPVEPTQETTELAGAPSIVAQTRRDGYIAWMRARNLYDPDLYLNANSWFGRVGKPLIRERFAQWMRLSSPPTAVFCANDALAIEVIHAAQAHGLDVPRQLSVVGVDNQIEGLLLKPRLTSIVIPAEEIGRELVKAMLNLMAGAPVEDCRKVLRVTNLEVGASTAPLT